MLRGHESGARGEEQRHHGNRQLQLEQNPQNELIDEKRSGSGPEACGPAQHEPHAAGHTHREQEAIKMPATATLRGQDWSTVTFAMAGRAPLTASKVDNTTAPRPIVSSTKVAGLSARKLDEETEELKHQTVQSAAPELKLALMKARTAKGMTQKALGAALNMPAATIMSYENGKALPDNAVIARLEKTLGAKLPRAKRAR